MAVVDPLVAIGAMAKAKKLPGRPKGTGTFNANERSIFGQQVIENKTAHNTTSMGKKHKTDAGSASVTRIVSEHEHNTSNLDDLDEEDEIEAIRTINENPGLNATQRAQNAARKRDELLTNNLTQSSQPKKRGRPLGSKNKPKVAVPPAATAPAGPAATDPTAAPPAKRKYTRRKKTVNDLRLPDEPAEEWA